jgi:hypothetical protein
VTIERRLAALVGRRIEHVRYVDLAEMHSGLHWRCPMFDSIDFGMELDLDDGATWSFIWKMVGFSGGVLVYPGSLSPFALRSSENIAIWDVDDHWRARGILDIGSVALVWDWQGIGPGLERTGYLESNDDAGALFLQTLVLSSQSGREAVISLGEGDLEGAYGWMPNNLAVFFSVADARAAGVLMPGDEPGDRAVVTSSTE